MTEMLSSGSEAENLMNLTSNTDLAKSPKGNITTFNNNRDEKISKFMKVYKKITNSVT